MILWYNVGLISLRSRKGSNKTVKTIFLNEEKMIDNSRIDHVIKLKNKL